MATTASYRAAVLQKRKALLKEAYKLTIRALSTMQEASPQDLAGIKQIAVSAVAEFIRSPDVFQFDLLGSPAVTQLGEDPQQQPLYQLLQTLLAGDVKVLLFSRRCHCSAPSALSFSPWSLSCKICLVLT